MHVATKPLAIDEPRRPFTTAEVARMIETGILDEEERIELIDGTLIEMAAKGVAHDMLKFRLTRFLVGATDPDLIVAVEGTLQLSERVLVEPDIAIFPETAARLTRQFIAVDGSSIPLLIEIATTSLAYDLGPKAALYARHGVGEYHVIDTNEQVTVVHAGPSGDGWARRRRVGFDDLLLPEAGKLSRVGLRLRDFA